MRYYVLIFLKGHANCQGEKQKFQKTHFLLSKVKSLKLCPLAILMPLEENPYIAPHLKALISC